MFLNVTKMSHSVIFKNLDTSQITDYRVINSVGSECYLDRVEVTGSNPV